MVHITTCPRICSQLTCGCKIDKAVARSFGLNDERVEEGDEGDGYL